MTPKTQNFDFQKISAYKIQNFAVIQKTGIYVVKLHTYQISKQCLSIRLCNGKKNTGKGDAVTFGNEIFGISDCRTYILCYIKNMNIYYIFLNPETKLDKIGVFLEENFDSENLTFFDLV